MPIHFDGKKYVRWSALIAAIMAKHPGWPKKRAERYAGGLKARQEGTRRVKVKRHVRSRVNHW